MTKQEEIREGIIANIGLVNPYLPSGWSQDYRDEFINMVAGQIYTGLHSQGVVIKVDRKLPRFPPDYVAVVPLIKEKLR